MQAQGSEQLIATGTLEILNTIQAKAEAECTECNGDFGPHGMMGRVSCLCRMQDAGTPCDDGKDCEGDCISGDDGFVCSEFETVFGCHSYLPDGWSETPHPTPVAVPTVCVD